MDGRRTWCKADEGHVVFPVGSGRGRAPTIFYAASWIAAGSPDIDWVRAWALELGFARSLLSSVAD